MFSRHIEQVRIRIGRVIVRTDNNKDLGAAFLRYYYLPRSAREKLMSEGGKTIHWLSPLADVLPPTIEHFTSSVDELTVGPNLTLSLIHI